MKYIISLSAVTKHGILLVQVNLETDVKDITLIDLPEKFKQLNNLVKEFFKENDPNSEDGDPEEYLYALTITSHKGDINITDKIYQWKGNDLPYDLQYNPIQKVNKYFLQTYTYLPVWNLTEEVFCIKVPDRLNLKGTLIQYISSIQGLDYTAIPVTNPNGGDYNIITVIRVQ
jgi:hypothetical protein|nr:MAG TPA: hypothetical protein [Caudoviricetes sp.]